MTARRLRRSTALLAALAVSLSLLVVGGVLSPSPTAHAAQALRAYALTKGHIDLFEVTYDQDANGLELRVKDDTRLHDPEPVFRQPSDVSIVVDGDTAAVDVSGAAGDFAFLKVDGDTVYQLPQTQNIDLPWPGWSTERLVDSLPPGTALPAGGQPVQLDVEVDGPGNVFTWQTGTFGGVQNKYVDTVDPADDVIPIARNAHVHTNWAFTEPGDYLLTVTPSATTTEGGTLSGPSAVYHVRIDDGSTARTVRLRELAAHYHQGGTIDLGLVADPELAEGDEVTWEWQWPDGDAWVPVPGASGDSHRVTAEQALDGVRVRATVAFADEEVGSISADPVTIAVDDHGAAPRQRLTISGPASAEAGETVTLTRVLPENGPTVLTEHRWERRAAGAEEWTVVSDQSGETLSFTAGPADEGVRYRVWLIKPDGQVGYGPSSVHTLTLGEVDPNPEPEPEPELDELAEQYELTLLEPTNGGVSSNALGINDAGDVVGITRPTGSAQPQRTVLWQVHGDHFHAHELANLDGSQFSRGFDLNDALQIVGEAFDSGGSSIPIRWQGTGAPRSVALNESGTGILNDINDAGMAVGTASGRAVKVTADGAVSVLPEPGPEDAAVTSFAATTIADEGAIGGRTSLVLPGETGSTLHGVVWDGDGTRLLTTPDGGSSPIVAGVRDDGVAVGSSTVGSTETAVLWGAEGSPFVLAPPGVAGYAHAAAKAIAGGVVVGYTSKFAGNTAFGGAAAAWDAGGAVDLSTRVVDLPDGVTLQAALDVNENGRIVGTATTADGARGFVLTPLAEDDLHVTGLAAHYHSGQAITLEATPESADETPATYHWSVRREDQDAFHPVAGATGASFTMTAEQALDGARVKAERLVDGVVTTTAEPVTVVVDDHGAPAPQVVTVAGATRYHRGDTATLNADVRPTTILDRYQWYVRPAGSGAATPIPGATTATYRFAAGAEHDGAAITVAVVGEDGRVAYGPSAAHSLTVDTDAPGPESIATSITTRAVRQVYGKSANLVVTVSPRATGTVSLKAGSRTLVGTLTGGRAKVTVPARALEPGARTVAVSYAGDPGRFRPSTGTAAVTVVKASPKLTVEARRSKVKRGRTAAFTVAVTAAGVKPSGRITVKTAGRSKTVRLNAKGRAIVKGKIPRGAKVGKKSVSVSYSGSTHVAKGKTASASIRVTR